MLVKTLIFVLVVAVATARRHSCGPNDNWPVRCGKRHCPAKNFECVNNKCRCKGRYYGQNQQQCVPPGWYRAKGGNDPEETIINDRAHANVPVPCMYLFSHIQNGVVGTQFSGAKCELKIYLYNTRVDGKMYIGGIKISTKITDMPESSMNRNLVFKVNGDGENSIYDYDYTVSLDGGSSYTDSWTASQIQVGTSPTNFTLDKENNIFILHIEGCGFNSTFRPADKTLSVENQPWIPGFAFMLDNNTNPIFASADEVVSMVPGQGPAQLPTGRDFSDELMSRAFSSAATEMTDFPHNSTKCIAVKATMNSCPDGVTKTQALIACRWILTTAPFVNCYSEGDNPGDPNKILDIYNRCMHAYCQKDETACEAYKDIIQGQRCEAKVPSNNKTPSCTF